MSETREMDPAWAAQLRPGVVTIDGYLIGKALIAPDNWNGWANPYFERATADALVVQIQAMIKRWGPVDTDQLRFEGDRLFSWREGEPEYDEWDCGILINGVLHYSIGAYGWTWYEVEPTPMRVDGEGPSWPVLFYDTQPVGGLVEATVPREWVEEHLDELAGFTTADGEDAASHLDDLEVAPGLVRLLGRFEED